jgi:hypothetical protein
MPATAGAFSPQPVAASATSAGSAIDIRLGMPLGYPSTPVA